MRVIVSLLHHFRMTPDGPVYPYRCLIIHSGVFGGIHPSPIKIGRGSWIGAHAVIAAGVSIGRGNLIGANAVVTKDTPNNVFVAGVPAKVISERKDNPGEIRSRHE